VLSEEGLPCLAWLVPGEPKPYFKHAVFNSVEKFCDTIEKLSYSKHNFYFAISTLKEESVELNGKKRVRVQSNTSKTRVFVLDIDVRPEKPGFYATKNEALEGVEKVQQALNLPSPIIVDSGFGLHVYWPMAAGVDSRKWMDAAKRFRNVIQLIAPEVVADGSRVADSAGVLRIPGSYNLKNGDLTPVQIIQWSEDVVDFGELSAHLGRLTGAPMSSDEAPGLSGVKPTERMQSEPVSIAAVARNCNWVKEYLTTPETASEPEWYAMLGLVPYLKYTNSKGEDIRDAALAHKLSDKHPEYNPEHTYAKYEQAKSAQTGPSTCERLRGIAPKRCEGCPFATMVKTPIATSELAREKTEPEVVETETKDDLGNTTTETVIIPVPPKPYFRGEEGGVYVRKRVKDEATGEWSEVIEKVYDYDMYPTRRFRTESLENEGMEIHLWLPKDGLRKFKLPNELLADNKSLNKFINMKGVVPEYGKSPLVCKYLVEYIRYLQNMKAAEIEYSHFGWRDVNTSTPKFVVAEGYYDCEGTLHPGTVAEHLRRRSGNDLKGLPPVTCAETKGDLDKWKQGYAMYENVPNSDGFILAALSGFAAPLFAFTPYSGMLYNMIGETGSGKSTALQAMASVFGIPGESRLRIDDTPISAFNTIGYLNSIAVSFDEMTKMEGNALSDFILALTGGRGKTRADRDGKNRVNETTWETIVCSSSNISVHEKVNTNRGGFNAEGMRMYERFVIKGDEKYQAKVNKCSALLVDNYGLAGREFIKYILPRTAKMRKILAQTQEMLAKKYVTKTTERFWLAFFACILISGKITKDILKLHNYDVEAIVARELGNIEETREQFQSSASDPVSTLGEFFNNNLTSLLRMNNGMTDLGSMSGVIHSIKIRLECDAGKPAFAYVSIAAVRDYCKTRNIDTAWLRQGLIQEKIIVRDNVQYRLTSGSNLAAVNCRCWKIDMNNPRLAGLALEEPITVAP